MTEKPKSKYQIGDVVEFVVGGFGVISKVKYCETGKWFDYAADSVEGLPFHSSNIHSWFQDKSFKGIVANSVRQIDHILEREDVKKMLSKIESDKASIRALTTTHGVAKNLLTKADIKFKSTHQIAKWLLAKEDREFATFVDEEPIDYSSYLLSDPPIKQNSSLDDFFNQDGVQFFNQSIKKGSLNGFCPVCRRIGIKNHPCKKCGTIIPYANAPVKGLS